MKKPLIIDVFNQKLNSVLSTIQLVTIVITALLICSDVLLRALFSKPISGTSEYVGYIMVFCSFFGLGLCTTERSHLKVDLIVQYLPKRGQAVFDIINDVFVFAVGTVIAYAAFNQGAVTFRLGTKGLFSGVPNWPFYYLMGLSYFSVATGSISLFIQDIKALFKPDADADTEKGEITK